MDPLSISASIIALAGATTSVIKTAEKFRSSLKAGDEICALINELTDLKCVLTTPDLDQSHPSAELASHLRGIIQKTNEKLSDLEIIINTRLLKPKSEGKPITVDRTAWLLQKSRIESNRKELRNLTSAFSLILATFTTTGVARVELAITALATTTSQSNGTTETSLGQLHQAMEALRLDTADLRDLLERQGRFTSDQVEITSDASSDATLVTSSDLDVSKQGYVQVRARRVLYGSICTEPCTCSCHVQRRVRSPAYFDNFMGMLFAGYTGLPVNKQTCNRRFCKNREQTFSATFSYYFPWWFVKRAFVTTFRLSALSGPEFTLRVARVIPDTSPIFQLARAGNLQGVKYLFENNLASPYDIGGGLGSTPLHYAVDRPRNFEIVKFLISAGADPEVQDLKQKTAADRIWNRIFGKGRDDEDQYVELLGNLSRTEQLGRRDFTHLHNIVLDQVPGDLDLELKTYHGVNRINDVDADGITALTWAARRGDYTSVETLLRHGADVSIATHTGATALYYAGASPSLDAPKVIRALLKAGAPVNACTFRQETPLHIGVMYHDDPKNFISPLVGYGADVNARDCRGISVLDLAIQSDHEKSVSYLLDQGVLLDRLGSDNITGLSVAIIYNSHRVLKLLMDRGADSSVLSKEQKTVLHLAAAYADSKTLDTLTIYGLDVERDALDSAGDTAEDIFDRRSDKDEALSFSFERLLESLGSGSIVYGELDPNDVAVMTDLLTKHEESPTSDEFFDAKEVFSTHASKSEIA